MLNFISSLEFNGCLNIYFNHGVIIDQKSNFTMLPAVLKSCSILLNTKISILKTSLLKALSFPFNLVFYFIFPALLPSCRNSFISAYFFHISSLRPSCSFLFLHFCFHIYSMFLFLYQVKRD